MEYAQLIDHTYLKPDATSKIIDKLIQEAITYNFKTICVNGTWTEYASQKLLNTNIGLTTVIGFPLGAMNFGIKMVEAELAIDQGATEIDMVMNIGWFKEGKYDQVVAEILAIKQTIGQLILKVIIETALLTPQEIATATELVIKGQADFVKTSTGFNSRGANFEDIEIMQKVAQGKIGIKAAGGIKTFQDLQKMVALGATRIGTSSGIELLKNQTFNSDY